MCDARQHSARKHRRKFLKVRLAIAAAVVLLFVAVCGRCFSMAKRSNLCKIDCRVVRENGFRAYDTNSGQFSTRTLPAAEKSRRAVVSRSGATTACDDGRKVVSGNRVLKRHTEDTL
jgi:hypothetical protein